MATAAQIQANRLNALRSTGPRSEQGKAVSRFNALKSGVDANSLVIPGEDPAELEALALAYREDLNPVGPVENFLVTTLVIADWNRRRYSRVEAQLVNAFAAGEDPAIVDPFSSALSADAAQSGVLQRVLRRLDGVQRTYFRALKELRRLQAERTSAAEEARAETAEPAVEPAAVASSPLSQSESAAIVVPQIGFVPRACPGGANGVRQHALREARGVDPSLPVLNGKSDRGMISHARRIEGCDVAD